MSLVLTDIWFRYPGADRNVLTGVNLKVEAGESCALMAPSGEGKTTLLSIAGLLLPPGKGGVKYSDIQVGVANAAQFLARDVAWILQSVNLLPRRSVLDNVALPLVSQGCGRAVAEERARVDIEAMGIAGLARVHARKLSGGEAQRVAIARGLVSRPRVLLADEPTANLDHATALSVIDALLGARRESAVLISTHDERIAALADRTVRLIDGKIVA